MSLTDTTRIIIELSFMLYWFIKTKQKTSAKLYCRHCLFIKPLHRSPLSSLSLLASFLPFFLPSTETQSHGGGQRCKLMLFIR